MTNTVPGPDATRARRARPSPIELVGSARRALVGWLFSRGSHTGGAPDVTKLRKVPASATYPVRRCALDPVPELDRARAAAPVTRLTRLLGLNIWLVTGYAEAKAVLADTGRYSNDMRHLLGNRARTAAEGIGGLGMTDAPDHTRLRALLTPEFTRRRLQRLDPLIDAIVDETVTELGRLGPEVDLVPTFASVIPFRVICELLGIDEVDRADFHELGAARFDISEGGPGAFGAATSSREFLIELVGRQRSDPGPGLIGQILREHGEEFDDIEIGGLADGAFLGGYETSASSFAMSVYLLTQHPQVWERLRVGSDAEVNSIVEELLRYLTAVQIAFPRFARETHDLFGHRVAKGDVVLVSLLAANRDDAVTADAARFHPAEEHVPHLTFGYGAHRCVGADLARMELRAGLRALATRFPDLRLSGDGADVAFRDLSIVYGIEKLPVRLWE
ncbi:MAG: cytochrome P450 [Nocardioides sp.]